MIHEINPEEFHVKYENLKPSSEDNILLFENDLVCFRQEGKTAILPRLSEFADSEDKIFIYLFSISDQRFFMAEPATKNPMKPPPGYEMNEYGIFRDVGPRHIAFAIVTAKHLHQWYSDRMFCGRCGAKTQLSQKERATICTKCSLTEYPKIGPCVIVGVTNGEKILLTRYKHHAYKRYALIAGFVEIGESLEDCVRREVFEETGVQIKDIKYYRSQPWGFTSTLLMGFFCQLDGDPSISIDEDELSEAAWLDRKDVPPGINDISLTTEMMDLFRHGQI